MKPRKQYQKASERFPVGGKVGNWTILEHVGRTVGDGHNYYAKCRCDCGAEHFVNVSNFSRGGLKNCQSCLHRAPWRGTVVVGAQFGAWTVIGSAERYGKGSGAYNRALCRCECGTERYCCCTDLLSGKTKNCRKCRKYPDLTRTQPHPVLNGDGLKKCNICGLKKESLDFHKCSASPDGLLSECKVCVKLRHIARSYGITPKQYADLMESADHCCQICGRHASHFQHGLHVDHIHGISGPESVRGVLCPMCNKSIGGFQDNPDLMRRAADYVEQGGFAKLAEAEDCGETLDSSQIQTIPGVD